MEIVIKEVSGRRILHFGKKQCKKIRKYFQIYQGEFPPELRHHLQIHLRFECNSDSLEFYYENELLQRSTKLQLPIIYSWKVKLDTPINHCIPITELCNMFKLSRQDEAVQWIPEGSAFQFITVKKGTT